MRLPASRNLAAGLIAAGLIVGVAPVSGVSAQQMPSANDITRSLTRGIRPGGVPSATTTTPPPATTATATPTQDPRAVRPSRGAGAVAVNAAPHAPAAAAATPAIDLSILFRTGSADLTPQAEKQLAELGKALASPELANDRFRIEGHTDTVGTRDANQELSARRASAVVDFLARRFNIDRGRLEAVGMGEDGLLVQTPEGVAEPRNRRVHVVNITA